MHENFVTKLSTKMPHLDLEIDGKRTIMFKIKVLCNVKPSRLVVSTNLLL
jgi:hypothetical protein